MRAILDTNLWSSFGDDGSLPRLDEILIRHDAVLGIPPSTLLEVVDIPHEDVRKRIILGLATGRRRTRLLTEADSFAAEVIGLIRRTRPEWMLQIPNPALAARHRTFWQKKVWAEALVDSSRMHEYQAGQKPIHDHIVERQKFHRRELLRTKFDLGPLTDLIGSSEGAASTGLPGWNGNSAAAWRLNLAQLTWYHLGVVGPRARLTGEDRTMTDWVEPYVDMRRLRSDPPSFVRMWLEEAQVEEVPRNWLNWAVDVVQWTQKVGSGNPADAQHAAYLLDCDVFLTADVRLVHALERVRRDAPFTFASTSLVSGDRAIPTADRIETALG